MATPAANARDFCTLIVKSRLLPADEVESLYAKWKDERPAATSGWTRSAGSWCSARRSPSTRRR